MCFHIVSVLYFDRIPLWGAFVASIGLGVVAMLIVHFFLVPIMKKKIAGKWVCVCVRAHACVRSFCVCVCVCVCVSQGDFHLFLLFCKIHHISFFKLQHIINFCVLCDIAGSYSGAAED